MLAWCHLSDISLSVTDSLFSRSLTQLLAHLAYVSVFDDSKVQAIVCEVVDPDLCVLEGSNKYRIAKVRGRVTK